jgi:4-hydroxy-2-oxoheptanedioate aldolase
MRARLVVVAVGVGILGAVVAAQKSTPHLNPMVDVLAAKKPIFGLSQPSNGRGGGGRGGNRGGAAGAGAAGATATPTPTPETPPPPPPPQKTPLELAKDALAHPEADYLFNGNMEGGVDRGLEAFTTFHDALLEAGGAATTPYPHLKAPFAVKTPIVKTDPAKAIENIGRQLNAGVTTIIMTGVETVDEVNTAISAMRFKSKGGQRSDDIGQAAKYWGLTDAQYRAKADLWPLNPDGNLLLWVIVESKPGLANVRQIAAVRGVSVMFTGAGTLGGVFSTTGPDGRRVRDDAAWEAANQQILSACKEAKLPCGYPSNQNDIESRMKEGWSAFIIQAGFTDAGFKAVELGRAAGGRDKK